LMKKMMLDDLGEHRETFILSVISFVRLHHFDGFDFNWYPDAETKDIFAQLIKEMRQSFHAEARISGRPRLLLTVAVPPLVERIDAGFDLDKLVLGADWLNVMAFDYHGSWDNVTGINTPIFNTVDTKSINTTISYLIDNRHVPSIKLVLGLAAYGRGWMLASNSNPNEIGVPAIGPSPAQPFTKAPGVAAYFEICMLIEKSNFLVRWDDQAQAPYMFKDGVWYSYDNTRSYGAEIDYMVGRDMAGVFVWTMDMTDFLGRCSSSKGKYPLLNKVRSVLAPKIE